MYKISNRGNIFGVNEADQLSQAYLEDAIKLGYLVKVDLWKFPKYLFTGIDHPSYEFQFNDIITPDKVLIEAKNLEAAQMLINEQVHGFIPSGSGVSFTNKGIPICFKTVLKNSIVFYPEEAVFDQLDNSLGICSDYIGMFT